jgi:hypothetical protein
MRSASAIRAPVIAANLKCGNHIRMQAQSHGNQGVWLSIPGKRQRCVTQGPQINDKVCALHFVLHTREKHICSRQSECGI